MEIAKSINSEGGMNAVNLRIAKQYLTGFGKLAKVNNTVILPADLSDIAGVITGITTVLEKSKIEQQPALKRKVASSKNRKRGYRR
jgi:hypothetical protein